jgi:ferritin-like metal-binding protein YciE
LILSLLDKVIFGATLILSLQIPQLADHYQQYLAGLYKATKWQVDGYESTARMHEFPDVRSMINRHLKNSDSSVRTDAEQKLATLDVYE